MSLSSHYLLYNIPSRVLTMQQTISFLAYCDQNPKKSRTVSLTDKFVSPKVLPADKRKSKKQPFAYARALNFSQSKYNYFPKWLISKPGFQQFMYMNYENKLLSIPRICEKKQRASQQLCLLNMYLSQIPLFQNLPSTVLNIILARISTRYCQAGEMIQSEGQEAKFMAVVFIGAIQVGKKLNLKQDCILTGAFYGATYPAVIAVQETVLLTISLSAYTQICAQLTLQMETKDKNDIAQLCRSTFFVEVGLKEKRAKLFRSGLKVAFYFAGSTVAQAGHSADHFYLLMRGKVVQRSKVYVRRHNKWPAQGRRWQVRAVYESHTKTRTLEPFDFFADQEILSGIKLASTYQSETPVVLLLMEAHSFKSILTQEEVKRLGKYRGEHPLLNYSEFETNIRNKTAEQQRCRNIVKQAIDTSYRSSKPLTKTRKSFMERYEKQMLLNVNSLLA